MGAAFSMITEVSSTGPIPIELDHAMQELRDTGRYNETLVARYALRAIRVVERRAQVTLRPAVTWKLTRRFWLVDPDDGASRSWSYPVYGSYGYGHRDGSVQAALSRVILLTNPPWVSTDSVTYFDDDDTEQTVDSANYTTVASDTAPAQLQFDTDYQFPTLRDREDAVSVTWTTGTSSPNELGISAALLMLRFFVDNEPGSRDEANMFIRDLRNVTYGDQ